MTQLCLRWTHYESSILQVFQEMYEAHSLVDVTIGCERSSLKAHKMVLAASSPYFQALFMDNPCKHPIVILKDIKFDDLKALIEFMYRGEVTVTQDQLPSLLKAAETLQITRLTDMGSKPSFAPIETQSVTNVPSLITYSKKKRKRAKLDGKSSSSAAETSETGMSDESDGEKSDFQSPPKQQNQQQLRHQQQQQQQHQQQEVAYVLETDSGSHVTLTSTSDDPEPGQEIQLVEDREQSSRLIEISMASVVDQPDGSVAIQAADIEAATPEGEEGKVTFDTLDHVNVISVGNAMFTSPGGTASHAIVLLKKKQSFVWEHFSETGKGSVKCRKCSKLLAYKDSSGSTSNMIKHLKTVHSIERVSKPPLQE